MQGTREWKNYIVEDEITPWRMKAGGIAVRVQGLQKFYALQLVKGSKARLVKALDGDTVLGEKEFEWKETSTYSLKLQVSGNQLKGWIDGQLMFEATDNSLTGGAVTFVVEQGNVISQAMSVKPIYK